MDRSLFFLTGTLVCVWFILDQFVGKKRIGKLADLLVGGANS